MSFLLVPRKGDGIVVVLGALTSSRLGHAVDFVQLGLAHLLGRRALARPLLLGAEAAALRVTPLFVLGGLGGNQVSARTHRQVLRLVEQRLLRLLVVLGEVACLVYEHDSLGIAVI